MGLPQHGASSHVSADIREYLNNFFTERWIEEDEYINYSDRFKQQQ